MTDFISVPELGRVRIIRRSGQRRLSVGVRGNGEIVATIPKWAPARSVLALCLEHVDSLQAAQREILPLIHDGEQIGRRRVLRFTPGRQRVLINDHQILVPMTENQVYHPDSQAAASKALRKALRQEVKSRIVPRVEQLSSQVGRQPTKIIIKDMSSRWGSCSNKGILNLSIYTAQLDDQLLDYVLIHELSHLLHLNHSPEFWAVVAQHYPNYKAARRQLRTLRPAVGLIKTQQA